MSDNTIETCDDDTLMSWAGEQWQELTSLIDTLALLLPLDRRQVAYDVKNCKIEFLHGTVTIEPFVFESKSILGIREKPGWLITTWKWTDEDEVSAAELVPHKDQETTQTDHAAVLAMLHVWEVLLTEETRKHGTTDVEKA